MTKVKALQVLVYITFALFILQDVASEGYRGFKEGYEDGGYAATHGYRQRGPLLFTTLKGDLLTHKPNGELKIDSNYTLQNITINGELRLSPQADTTPFWLDALYGITIIGTLAVLILIAVTINKVIVKITQGNMFDELCIKLIRRIASLLLLYTLIDYLYQRISYLKNTRLVHAPFLSVAGNFSFNIQVLICAMMVFIVAEAFKQGYRLKQDQDLTI